MREIREIKRVISFIPEMERRLSELEHEEKEISFWEKDIEND